MPADPDLPAMARLLAEAHAARSLARARPAAARESGAVDDRALWAHARRAAGEPVSLAVTRAIRTDPRAAARYRTMLAAVAVAHAPFAIAASDGAVTRRQVGPFALEVVPAEDESPPLLVIRLSEGGVPRLIEAGAPGEGVRLDLPEPVEGTIVLALDPSLPEAAQLASLLRDPRSEVFLV